jgi:F-type H+-transporting ATPase subunit b
MHLGSQLGHQLGALLLGGAIIDLDGTFFLQAVIFGLLYVFLRFVVFKPVMAVLDARETATDGAKDEARDLEAQAKEKLAAFENEMTRVKVELSAERDKVRKDGTALERELLSKARTDADAILAEASKTIEAESAQVRSHMKSAVPALAADIANKLLGEKGAS